MTEQGNLRRWLPEPKDAEGGDEEGPAAIGGHARQLTRRAGEAASFGVPRLVGEGMAARVEVRSARTCTAESGPDNETLVPPASEAGYFPSKPAFSTPSAAWAPSSLTKDATVVVFVLTVSPTHRTLSCTTE